MSIYGSLTTAVTGLNAQSRALGAISDNIANSQTNGYKRVNTSFSSMVLMSNERVHAPGGVTSTPMYVNNIQGNISSTESATNLAIQGQGFFSVSKLTDGQSGPGQVGNTVQTQTGTLNAESVYYTRNGDFELDKNRYLVNTSGYALNGWLVNSDTGALSKDQVQPIQVSSLIDKPDATKTITLNANLPATPSGVLPTQSIKIIDTQGNQRSVNLNFRQQGNNDWRLTLDTPGSSTQPVSGTYDGYPANVTYGTNSAGITPVALVTTLTIGDAAATVNGQNELRVGETYKVTIDGTTYSYQITEDNVATVGTFSGLAGAIANTINSASPSPNVTATVTGNVITLTAKTAGTKVKIEKDISTKNQTTNTVSRGAVTAPTATAGGIQKLSFPQSSIDIGDSWSFTLTNPDANGGLGVTKTITLTVTAQNYASLENISGVTQALADKIGLAGLGLTASSSGGQLSIQSTYPLNAAAVPPTVGTFTIADMSGGTTATDLNFVTNATAATTITQAPVTAYRVGNSQAQTITLSGTPGDVGTEYTISINDTPITYKTTGQEISMAEISAALADTINSNTSLPVQATSTNGVITLQAKTQISPAANLVDDGAGDISFKADDTKSSIYSGDSFSMTANVGGTRYTGTFTATSATTYSFTYQNLTGTHVVTGNASGAAFAEADVMNIYNNWLTDGTAGVGLAQTTSWTSGATALSITTAGNSLTGSSSNVANGEFTLQDPTVSIGKTPAYVELSFGSTSGTVGTLTNISTAHVGTGTALTTSDQSKGKDGTITFTVDYGFGPQTVTVNMGTFQTAGGLTQYAGTDINVTKFVQDGVQRGEYKDVSFNDSGEVVVNYDNGRSKVIARVPVVTFNNPNALTRATGDVFLESEDAGKPNFNDSGNNGAGTIVSSSVEGSNVDIAEEFTKLIVTQRSYSANTKIVTTSDEMLQEVLQLKR